MKIAIEGCAHGELEKIYDVIQFIEEQENYKVDLLICCGDFESTRNLNDLQCMAVPQKYQEMGTFYKYFSGEKKVPIPTIFIGGNHEASNYLQELPYGGWVAPDIFYLGYAGVINVNGLRIGGLSGIYKSGDFFRGRYEYAPYDEQSKRSVYHIRQLDVFRLKQLTPVFDIFLSHDWPVGVYNYGDLDQLIRFKPHFQQEIENNELGSKPAGDLLNILKPKYWFSAHLHCKFSAIIPHLPSKATDGSGSGQKNEETIYEQETKFLALDKCLPKRRFLQVIDVDVTEEFRDKPPVLNYDLEWLTVLHLTNHLINVKHINHYMPDDKSEERFDFRPSEDEKNYILGKFDGNLEIPKDFVRTAVPYDGKTGYQFGTKPASFINPQTTTLCNQLNIDDPLSLAMLLSGHKLINATEYPDISNNDDLNAQQGSSTNIPIKKKLCTFVLPQPKLDMDLNPDEIDIAEDVDSREKVNTVLVNDEKSQVVKEKEIDGDDSCKPDLKKFKRRNQAIYTANDDNQTDM